MVVIKPLALPVRVDSSRLEVSPAPLVVAQRRALLDRNTQRIGPVLLDVLEQPNHQVSAGVIDGGLVAAETT